MPDQRQEVKKRYREWGEIAQRWAALAFRFVKGEDGAEIASLRKLDE